MAMGNVGGQQHLQRAVHPGPFGALITPLVVNVQLIRQEVPIMVGASLVLLDRCRWTGGCPGLDADGALSLVLMVAYTVFLVMAVPARDRRLRNQEYGRASLPFRNLPRPGVDRLGPFSSALIVAGPGFALVLGSGWLVEASVNFAKALGVSDLVIGLTIVAAGTTHARGSPPR
jgi:cation:H+ antiporter